MTELLESGRVEEALYSFAPSAGDAVFLKAGTVHNLEDVVVLGIEQNSDITFRLYDWDRVDETTGRRRELQVAEAMGCIDFSQGSIKALEPVIETASPVMREKLFDCTHFRLWRIQAQNPFQVGEEKLPRAVVCLEGKGWLDCKGSLLPVARGDVFLLPASVGVCSFRPEGEVVFFEAGLSGL
jgi:mannose-6-phosphate isomerase